MTFLHELLVTNECILSSIAHSQQIEKICVHSLPIYYYYSWLFGISDRIIIYDRGGEIQVFVCCI